MYNATLAKSRVKPVLFNTKELDEEDLEKKNKIHRRRVAKLTKEEREDQNAEEELRKFGLCVDESDENDNADGEQAKSSATDEEDEEDLIKKKKSKKIFYGKKRKIVEPEVIPDPTDLPSIIMGKPLEPLTKRKRQPAQEQIYKELTEINDRIVSLIQIRQMGLTTDENKQQLKQLMKDRRTKAFALRRLQLRVRASNKYRMKQRKIVR